MIMTYRTKIEEMIRTINTLYEDAEWLRDYATEEEKIHWNSLRRILYDADAPLRKLNNSLSISRGSMKL